LKELSAGGVGWQCFKLERSWYVVNSPLIFLSD
jgi:hypothetical protein